MTRGPTTSFHLVLAAGLTTWAASCALDGFARIDARPTSTVAATTSTGGAGGSGGEGGAGGEAPTCISARYPPPPDVEDAGGDVEVVVALRELRVTEGPRGEPLGIDIDRACTCSGDGPTCKHAPGTDECDLEGGRDNAALPIFNFISETLNDADLGEFYSERADQGDWSMLVQILDYNGEDDDDRVRVRIYSTSGFAAPMVPQWDGTDAWPISATSLGTDSVGVPDLEQPLYTDDNAYVTGGFVVANLPKNEIVFAGSTSRLAMKLTAGGIMGRLVEQGDRWSLRDGLITGLMADSDLFATISSFRSNSDEPICKNNPAYGYTRNILCNGLDTQVTLGGPLEPCDALSFGVGFAAEPATLGAVEPAPAPSEGCAPELDPINDSCAPVAPTTGAGGAGGG